MKASDFVTAIEKYYGKYSSEFKRTVVQEYADKISETERPIILRLLVEAVSDQYRSVPDVAAIRKVREENTEEIAQKSGGIWRDELTGKYWIGKTYLGFYDGHTFIPNTMLQDREKLGYICNPVNERAYADWLREQHLLPSDEKLAIAPMALDHGVREAVE
jgi:hypothetical protein